MTDKMKTVQIDLEDTTINTMYEVLTEIFPGKTVDIAEHVSIFSQIFDGILRDCWPVIRDSMQCAGLEDEGIMRVRKTLLLTVWNQLAEDLSGKPIQIVEKEKAK